MNRPVVVLSNDDQIAAAQILAHLSYPARPEKGWDILQQWSRHLAKAGPSEKWSRLEPKLWRLDDMLKRRLKGSYWLRFQINQKVGELTGDYFHAATQRACARMFGAAQDDQRSSLSETNIIRDYWQQTRTVAHLGLAVGDSMLRADATAGRLANGAYWDLRRIAFRPDWVANAIAMAEENAAAANEFEVIKLSVATQFVRDAF